MKEGTGSQYRLVLFAAIGLFAAGLMLPIFLTWEENGGRVIYSLDDPYIHLSIAKNLAGEGVWGVTPYEFSSSASSILYPLLLAGVFVLTGPFEALPLLLNIGAGIAVIFLLVYLAKREKLNPLLSLALLLVTCILLPLSSLALTGMEHIGQIGINLSFMYLVASRLSGERVGKKYEILLPLLAAAVMLIRFEGMLLVAIAIFLLLLQKQYQTSARMALFAAIPLILFGSISLLNGGMFFPNSVMIKGVKPVDEGFISLLRYSYSWLKVLYQMPYLLVLLLGLSFGLLISRIQAITSRLSHIDFFAIQVLMVSILQIQVTGLTDQYRYYSYLLVAAFCVGAFYLNNLRLPDLKLLSLELAAGLFVLLILGYPLLRHSMSTVKNTPIAMGNIYQQQIQMAKFLNAHYDDAGVAANDIGAISYYTNIHLLDMVGLGSTSIAQEILRQNGRCLPGQGMELFYKHQADKQDVQLAIIYDTWVGNCVPSNWERVGQWSISDNVTCGDSMVSFYAVRTEKEELMTQLRGFSAKLPEAVIEYGEYLKPQTKNKF